MAGARNDRQLPILAARKGAPVRFANWNSKWGGKVRLIPWEIVGWQLIAPKYPTLPEAAPGYFRLRMADYLRLVNLN